MSPTQAEAPGRDRGNKTEVYAENPIDGHRLTQRCGKHGERLTVLDREHVEDLEIERGGMSYTLEDPEDTRIGYCVECLAVLRNRNHDYRDTPDADLVKNRIEKNWGRTNYQGFRQLFEPATASVGRGLKHCPFCGEYLDMVNRNSGRCICPDHGEMGVKVRQVDVE